MVYWAFPATEGPENFVYPTRVLVYNYRNGSWAFNDDCFTCFGYFEQQADVIWSDCYLTWAEYEATWTSGVLQSQFRQIIGGNQEGFVTVINADLDNNAPALQISRVQLATPAAGLVTLTIRDHTIPVGSCISLSNMNGLTITGDPLYIVVAIDVAAHEIIIDTDFSNSTVTGTYTGGGLAARVSNPKMLTKQFNPYIKEGKNVYLAKVDFYVQKTAAAEITVDYYPSASTLSMINAGTVSGAQTGSNILETSAYAAVPFEAVQNKVWHPIYFQTVGESVQLCLSLSNAQLVQAATARDGFKLDGMVLYTMPISRLE